MPAYIVTLRDGKNKTSKIKIIQASSGDAEKEATQRNPGFDVINVSRESDDVFTPSTRRRGPSSD